MRTREQIEKDCDGNNELFRLRLHLEVLLDIRELLILSNEYAKEASDMQKQWAEIIDAAPSGNVA